ncbi:MAG: hypothetical protein AAB131_05700, partial [Actinomycetota bacterium]
ALARAARGRAFLDGRGYVTPQDVKSVGLDVLRHRVVPTYEAEAEGVTSEDLVERIAALADWQVVKWLPGDEGQASSQDGQVRGLGQSIVVLTR